MTCAACAARIERRLNKIDGVVATVNYATERAAVSYDRGSSTTASLIATIQSLGYDANEAPTGVAEPIASQSGDDSDAAPASVLLLRRRLIISAALALPVVAISMIPGLQFDRWQWVVAALATPVVLWGGVDFHRVAFLNLRQRTTTMDTLISVGTLTAFGWSLYALLFGHAGMTGMQMTVDWTLRRDRSATHLYFEVASAVIVFVLAGRYFERRAKHDARAAIRAVLDLGAREVSLLLSDQDNATERRVPTNTLRVGDHFVVRPGERIATDGVVVRGESSIDASMITGESVPVDVGVGSTVTGATVNANGRIVVRATRVGAHTALAQLARLVDEAQSGKAPVQRLADRISAVFVPVVMAVSSATLLFWLIRGAGPQAAFTAAVSVLIVACPCALGLATPTALLVGSGRGAELGIAIRGPQILESSRRVDTIVFDKTGTLTTGTLRVVAVAGPDGLPLDGTDLDDFLRAVGAVEEASEHPLARAIANEARSRLNRLPVATSFVNRSGLGVEGYVDGRRVLVGRRPLMAEHGIVVPSAFQDYQDGQEASGRTVILGAIDDVVVGSVSLADEVRPTSRGAIAELQTMGLHPMLLTGDNRRVATAVANEVGIDDVAADVLPAEKLAHIRQLQSNGRVVAMAGDGVNDAAALAQADLGIAMGTGTDAAIAVADLTLVGGSVERIADAILLSRKTLATIKTNLFWAFGYNVAAIPLAASGLLNPLVAGAAMTFSSVFVVANSLRLKRFTPRRLS